MKEPREPKDYITSSKRVPAAERRDNCGLVPFYVGIAAGAAMGFTICFLWMAGRGC